MGYMRHTAMVVVVHADADVEQRVMALRESMPPAYRPLLVGPVDDAVHNGYHMYAFLPDGSKEGWAASDKGDQYRQEFRDLLKLDHAATYHAAVCEIDFGGDDPRRVSVQVDSYPNALT